jgi:hypothetical protein
MSSAPQVFRSRWGFHPCAYATYRQLKLLNLVYRKAVRLAHAWQRWERKDPHNRVSRRRLRDNQGQAVGYGAPVPLPEPRLCPVFSQKAYERRYVDKKGRFYKDGFVQEVVQTDDLGISADYAAARKPQADPGDVRPLRHTPDEIDALYRQALAWLEGQDVS